jgi:predicted nucleic acid-binding protein
MNPVYLLDTNVISEISKLNPNMTVVKKLNAYDGLCAICSTVWQESIFGLSLMPEGKKKTYKSQYIQYVRNNFDIIPYDSFAAQICGEIRAKCKEAGSPAPFFNSQIAATAIANNMILITHNTEDYAALQENSMLRIEDWWE